MFNSRRRCGMTRWRTLSDGSVEFLATLTRVGSYGTYRVIS